MTSPTQNPMYIRLTTTAPLQKSEVKMWFNTVKSLLPSGVLGSLQVRNPDNELTNVQLIHKTEKGKHLYEIPLNRDMVPREVEPIVTAWDAYYPEGDFDIETSAAEIEASRQKLADAIVVKENEYNQLCDTLAKHQHTAWYKSRADKGWRYGISINRKDKTHPMMRPWEELPEEYRTVDYELPKMLMNFFEEQGYVVVKKTDLAKWLQGPQFKREG